MSLPVSPSDSAFDHINNLIDYCDQSIYQINHSRDKQDLFCSFIHLLSALWFFLLLCRFFTFYIIPHYIVAVESFSENFFNNFRVIFKAKIDSGSRFRYSSILLPLIRYNNFQFFIGIFGERIFFRIPLVIILNNVKSLFKRHFNFFRTPLELQNNKKGISG